jgi:hypothetical protein
VPFYFISKKSKSKNHRFQVFEKSQGTGGFCERTIILEPLVQGCSKKP